MRAVSEGRTGRGEGKELLFLWGRERCDFGFWNRKGWIWNAVREGSETFRRSYFGLALRFFLALAARKYTERLSALICVGG